MVVFCIHIYKIVGTNLPYRAMNQRQLYCETHELVNSFNVTRTKLLLDSFANDSSEKSKIIQKQIEDLEYGHDEAQFLALLFQYLDCVDRDRQQLLLENNMLRDELNYINDQFKIVDQNVISLEEQQRQDQFDKEIQALNELLERDLKFNTADVSNLMHEKEYAIDVSNDNIAPEIPTRTKVAATYFTKYLNEGNFDVAVPTCQRFINELQSNHADRLEVAAMLEIQVMAFRNDLQFIDAANMLKTTLTIYDEMLQVGDPLILITLKNLVQLYGMMNLCTDDQNPAKQLMNMAITSENLSNFDTAAKLYREVLEIYEQLLGNGLFFEERSISGRERLSDDSVHQGQHKKIKNQEHNLKLEENVISHRNEISAPAVEETRPNQKHYGVPKHCISPCNCNSCEGFEEEERARMLCDLVFEGLPEMSFNNKKEQLKDAVCKIGGVFGVPIKESDILTCYRIGRVQEKRGPRTVIVTYKSKATRNAVYYAYRKKRNLMFKDIFPETNSQVRVYISERLTASCCNLLRRCAALKKRNIIEKFFTMNGRLYIQRIIQADKELATPELIESLEKSL